jgi:hypothetical protein
MSGHCELCGQTGCNGSCCEASGYNCVVCGRFLPADEHGVIVHDNVPHPDMDFDEESKPQ